MWKKWAGKMPPFVAVVEMHESGWPHLHFVVKLKGEESVPPQKLLKKWWLGCGGGWSQDFQPLIGDGRYIAKYLDKGSVLPSDVHGLLLANKIRMIYSSNGLKTEKSTDWVYKRGSRKQATEWLDEVSSTIEGAMKAMAVV